MDLPTSADGREPGAWGDRARCRILGAGLLAFVSREAVAAGRDTRADACEGGCTALAT